MEAAEATVQAHVRDALATIREAGVEVEGLSGSLEHEGVFTKLHCATENPIPAADATELAIACRGVVRAYHERYAKDRDDIEALVHETYRRLVAVSTSSPRRLRSVPGFLLEAA